MITQIGLTAEQLTAVEMVVSSLRLDHSSGYNEETNQTYIRITYNDRHISLVADGKVAEARLERAAS